MSEDQWDFACPECRGALRRVGVASVLCPRCCRTYSRCDEIWRLLTPVQRVHFEGFLDEYVCVRTGERRTDADGEFCRKLPDCDARHPQAWEWSVRRRSFEALRGILRETGRPLRIVDLGAGNGWLSNRLTQTGHSVCAVDINLHPGDGLGASRYYGGSWPRLEADFDRLPLADACCDAVVYNGAFHYTPDERKTLLEALRVLRPSGNIFVMDSPLYRDESSGRRMAAERASEFERRYGKRRQTIACRQFLTWNRVEQVAKELGLTLRIVRPHYGWAWTLRSWKTRLRLRREPATFAVLVFGRSGGQAG